MMVLCLAMTMQAQEKETVNAYFTPEEMPDMMVFLPGPPDSTSVAFMNDVARYYWGKEMRKDPNVLLKPPVMPCMVWRPSSPSLKKLSE